MSRRHGAKKLTTWQYDEGGNSLKVNVYQLDDAETRGVTPRVALGAVRGQTVIV